MAKLTSQRIELGGRLRAARTAAGVSTRAVEAALDWHVGKVSRVETGTRVPTYAEVDALARLFKLAGTDREVLHALAKAARKRGQSSRVADFAQGYMALEEQAATIDYLDAELVPGLLQIDDYARALLTMSRSEHRAEYLDSRLARREILQRADAPRLRVILGEAVLHRQVGGTQVLRTQLEHLVEMGHLDHVEIQLLPFAVGAHRALGVGFTLVSVADPAIERVYIEGLTGATYLHEAAEVAVYRDDFDALRSLALSPAESATMIRRHIGTSEG